MTTNNYSECSYCGQTICWTVTEKRKVHMAAHCVNGRNFIFAEMDEEYKLPFFQYGRHVAHFLVCPFQDPINRNLTFAEACLILGVSKEISLDDVYEFYEDWKYRSKGEANTYALDKALAVFERRKA